jgi:uncharacterized protein YndB with AHSA1/START domain
MNKEISQTWFFKQPPEEVWDYLTKPELIEQWLMKTNLKPIVGYKFQFTFVAKEGSKYKGFVDCEILEVIPFQKLSYTWDGEIADGSRVFNSEVVWTLTPKEEGTELQLLHNGFEVLEDLLNHASGWQTCVERLNNHINTRSL